MSWSLSPEQLRAYAARRERQHADSPTSQRWAPDRELMGVIGEYTFARALGLPFVADSGSQGDGGRDAKFWVGSLTFDVKNAKKPVLLRPVGRSQADILVLALYDPLTETARLLGWQFDHVMTQLPTEPGRGGLNHAQKAEDLRPMAELVAWIEALRSKRRR